MLHSPSCKIPWINIDFITSVHRIICDWFCLQYLLHGVCVCVWNPPLGSITSVQLARTNKLKTINVRLSSPLYLWLCFVALIGSTRDSTLGLWVILVLIVIFSVVFVPSWPKDFHNPTRHDIGYVILTRVVSDVLWEVCGRP